MTLLCIQICSVFHKTTDVGWCDYEGNKSSWLWSAFHPVVCQLMHFEGFWFISVPPFPLYSRESEEFAIWSLANEPGTSICAVESLCFFPEIILGMQIYSFDSSRNKTSPLVATEVLKKGQWSLPKWSSYMKKIIVLPLALFPNFYLNTRSYQYTCF